jgi:hypothetical protein
MSDEELAGRLRAAVLREAEPVTDDRLADRLLHGTARRRRGRRAAALAVTAGVLAGAGLTGTVLLTGGEDALSGGDVAGAPDDPPPLSVSEAEAVTVEQAAREGVDGTAECESDAISAPQPDGAGVVPKLTLYAAYLTDPEGYEQWEREYTGGDTARDKRAGAGSLLALCWFTGDVPADQSVGGPPARFTHQLVTVQLTGPASTAGLRLDARSPRPLPVLAPPAPTDLPAGASLRSFPQPDGIRVLEELPPRPAAPSPAEPVNCTPTACVDPNEEVVVRADTRVDGQPLDPSGYRELTPGQTVTLELTLDVEQGQTISDVHFALSKDGIGMGPEGPLGLGDVFARAPSVAGSRTFEVPWVVPELAEAEQLVLTYRSDKYQAGAGHARSLGGVTVPGAAPYR